MPEMDPVRLLNDPTRVGFLTGREQMRRGRRLLQVQFADGVRWIPEAQLESVRGQRLSPLDMLEAKKLGRPVDLRRTLTHVKLSGRLADVIYSMEATNTDFYAYQFKPVIKILESPANGILIADEVGLGKTIEAGLIWTELRSRFDMRRLLVLCPATLRDKWERELRKKIGVAATVCNARDVLNILRDEDSRARGFALIASTQGLRPPRDWEEDTNKKATAELARFLRSMESEPRLLDLLVIDEAHHLRNPETQTNELGQLAKNVAEYTILLTATPIHNRNEDLFSLLHLLDPDTFTRPEVFAQILEANKPLVRARDLVLGPNVDAGELRALLENARSHPLLRSNRQLSMIEETDLVPEHLQRRDVRSRLAYRLETVNLLAHVVTRTRKRDVKEWRVLREPIPEFVDLDLDEKKFYDLVTGVVVEYALQRDANDRFLLAQPQRQMTSCIAASLRAWQRKLVELEESEETGEADEDEERRSALGPLVTEIILRSRDYVELERLIQVDTKYGRLRTILAKFLRDHPKEKIVVFSSFCATLDYLAERLTSDGVSCIVLKGRQRETKDDIILRFSKPDGPSVLLSSEVGGEGIDLQFSWIVINYDLPWNPMRLEQRIGRVDRLGQKADKVLIWNILYKDTIDSRIYQRLYEKLDLCRSALGDFEEILGDAIRKLTLDLLSGHLSPQQQEQRIDQTAQALENLRLEEQHLEQDAANLVAYGDYILNQVQAARELNRWISGEDLQRYVLDHLRLHYQGCEVRQEAPASPIFEIQLSDRAKFDLAEFIRRHRLAFTTRLTSASSRPVRCRFENRVTGATSHSEEIISQFHPLVRMVSHRIRERDEQLTPAVALKLAPEAIDGRLRPGTYVLAAALWSFQGLQDTEKLAYAAAPLDASGKLLEPELAERLAVAAVASGQDWLEARNVVDLELAYNVANHMLFAHLDEEYEAFSRELRARNEDRADVQIRTLEQHLRLQTARLQETLQKHRARGRESLVQATEGRIRALESRVEQQRLRIESRRVVRSDNQDIAIAIIGIGYGAAEGSDVVGRSSNERSE
jgi:superfamily II DNA or RNA helicase